MHVKWERATRGSSGAAYAFTGTGVASAEAGPGVRRRWWPGLMGQVYGRTRSGQVKRGERGQERPGRGYRVSESEPEGQGQGFGGY